MVLITEVISAEEPDDEELRETNPDLIILNINDIEPEDEPEEDFDIFDN